jgi:nicotinate-nucleotide adenylyltransferase
MDYIEITEITKRVEIKIAATLSPKRYAHCKSTGAVAVMLSERFGVNKEASYLAGLSHDMCRELSFEEQENLVDNYGACIAFLRGRPSLEALFSDTTYKRKMIHGPAAACLLCHEFGMREPDILEAVALHSVADEEMSNIAKIVYISDKLEPLRSRPQDVDEKLHTLDLDALFVYTIACVVHWFSEADKPLSPFTADLYSRMLK